MNLFGRTAAAVIDWIAARWPLPTADLFDPREPPAATAREIAGLPPRGDPGDAGEEVRRNVDRAFEDWTEDLDGHLVRVPVTLWPEPDLDGPLAAAMAAKRQAAAQGLSAASEAARLDTLGRLPVHPEDIAVCGACNRTVLALGGQSGLIEPSFRQRRWIRAFRTIEGMTRHPLPAGRRDGSAGRHRCGSEPSS